jgi:dihydrolipoamide dehydrogenase
MDIFDLIVIGAGPGGYVAAERAGMLGKRVLLIEKEELGGVCTNWGCIPTKSLLNSAKMYDHARNSEDRGVKATAVSFDLSTAMTWKQQTIETLRSGIQFLMKQAKVTVVRGEATCLDAHHVQVADTVYQTEDLIIATGSSPVVPPIPGSDLDHVMTSNEVLTLKELPESMVIIGGGVIGIEFASFFSTVGVKVTVVEMMDEILPMVDTEFAKLMRREMKEVDFHLSCKVTKITSDAVHYVDAQGVEQSIAAQQVLMSVGRRANTQNLEALHLDIARTGIVVDEYLKTNVPHVYAIGDVNGKSLLAHSASRMADVVIAHLYGERKQRMRYHAIPWAVYSNPEAAGCGLTEQAAKEQGKEIVTATVQMRANGRFLAEQGKRSGGLCKVVADKHTKVILGIHLLGSYSSEIIWGAASIIESELRIQDVKEVVFPHPSVSEVIKDALFSIDHTL